MSSIELPWEKPPLTKNAVRRMHHHAEAKARRTIVEAVSWIARANLEPVGGAIVILHWRMPDKRRRDGDGAAPTLAACIDGLVRAGILKDDSWVEVSHSGVTTHAPIAGKPGAMWLTVTDPNADAA